MCQNSAGIGFIPIEVKNSSATWKILWENYKIFHSNYELWFPVKSIKDFEIGFSLIRSHIENHELPLLNSLPSITRIYTFICYTIIIRYMSYVISTYLFTCVLYTLDEAFQLWYLFFVFLEMVTLNQLYFSMTEPTCYLQNIFIIY